MLTESGGSVSEGRPPLLCDLAPVLFCYIHTHNDTCPCNTPNTFRRHATIVSVVFLAPHSCFWMAFPGSCYAMPCRIMPFHWHVLLNFFTCGVLHTYANFCCHVLPLLNLCHVILYAMPCSMPCHAMPRQAASNGKAQLCREMVKRGADIDARNKTEYTPLHWACFKVRIYIPPANLRTVSPFFLCSGVLLLAPAGFDGELVAICVAPKAIMACVIARFDAPMLADAVFSFCVSSYTLPRTRRLINYLCHKYS